MRPELRRCPKCGLPLVKYPTEWRHTSEALGCDYRQERFIKPETSHPLFLAVGVKAKDKETRKFLEDIMQEPVTEEKHDEWKELIEGVVFTKTRINGIVKILKVEDFREHCERLIKEMKDKEASTK